MEDTIIKALLLGYTHIECNGTPIRICLKKAQGLLFYLLVHKKATRDVTAGLLADIALLASPETNCQGLFNQIHKKGARSTAWLLTPRLTDYIFPFSRSLQRYA